MKLPTVPFFALALGLPRVASAFANKNCPHTRKTAEKNLGKICQFTIAFLQALTGFQVKYDLTRNHHYY